MHHTSHCSTDLPYRPPPPLTSSHVLHCLGRLRHRSFHAL